MIDGFLNLMEMIGNGAHLPRYPCLIRGQHNVETNASPNVLAWIAHLANEAFKFLDHAMPDANFLMGPLDGFAQIKVDIY